MIPANTWENEMKINSIILSFVVLLFAAVCFATLQTETWPVPAGLHEYEVLKVIDGDTIRVAELGRVRYTGIDAPEIRHGRREAEPYGYEAMEANRKLVQGKKVKIELDVAKRDHYGRVLGYVYIGNVFVNAYLVESGYACAIKVKPNVRYWELLFRLQNEASKARRGLWTLPLSKTNWKH
jgi:micrococcal nuclease